MSEVIRSTQKNYILFQGDDLRETLNIKQSDGTTAEDITNYTFFITLKSDYDTVSDDTGAAYKAEWSVHSDPTNGVTTLHIPNSSTSALLGVYLYDVQAKNNTTGDISTLLYGHMDFRRDVTNRTS